MSTTLPAFWPNKSTNGRSSFDSVSAAGKWGRLGFQLLGWVAPKVAQQRALERFLTPPAPLAASARTPEFPGLSSDAFRVKLRTALGGIEETMDLAVTVWGRGPAVYLMHGWGGRASQWSSFVEPLAQAGLSAVVFDAPGHGASPAPRTSIPHFSAALAAVVDDVGPARAVIGHSMGGVAAAHALARGLSAERIALLGAPADPTEIFARFLGQIGLPRHLYPAIWEKFEAEYGFASNELPVRPPQHAPAPPALVVHDRNDHEVPYASADRIVRVWPGATLVTTAGLGHRRLLRDADVIRRVVHFVAGAGV
jgi:pimeloyl-ACP methyl ester carboxylesterase